MRPPRRSRLAPLAVASLLASVLAIAAAPPPAPALSPVLPASAGHALRSPIPGGVVGGWAGDTGLDIASMPAAVYAIAGGTLDYSEYGHTRWRSGRDTPYSVRIKLDAPIAWKNRRITHAYYTHLSALAHVQHEGDEPRLHVEAGERLGTSGYGNGVPHLHLGLLLDDQVEQDDWDTLLVESEVRAVLGVRNGATLPRS